MTVELQAGLRDLRRALQRPLGRTRPRRGRRAGRGRAAARRASRARDRARAGQRRGRRPAPSSSRSPSPCSSRPSGTRASMRSRRAWRCTLDREEGAWVMEVCNDGVRGRARTIARDGAPARGARGAPGRRARRVRRARARHLARAAGGARMSAPDVNPSRIASGSGERKLRVLVVDDHEVVHWGLRLMLGEQPWVERCLSARNGEEAMALLTPLPAARGARRPVRRAGVGGRDLRAPAGRAADDERAADLRRGADQPERRARGRRRRLHLQGLAGRRHRRGGADGRARHDRVPPARGAGRPAAHRARARGARPDRRAARRTARSPSSSSSRRTPSRSTRRRCTASCRCATGPRRCRRRSGSASSRERDRPRPRGARPARLHQPRPRRRRRATRPSTGWSARRTRCSTPRTTRGVRQFDAARSYGRAEAFLASWLQRARAGPRRRRRQLEVGLRVHGRLAASTPRSTRSRSSARRSCGASGRETLELLGDVAAALPDPLRDGRERRARRPGRASGARRRCGRPACGSGSA